MSRRFGAIVALDGVELAVGPGEIVAIVGPSGAGKSTLLRILATLVLPDSGEAQVGGHDVVAAPAAARGALGLVLGDERAWYWRLSGRRNLIFFAALAGMRRRDAEARSDALIARVGLDPASAARAVGRYSSGMRARLALARGLIVDPAALVLDEPTRSLDVASSDAVRALITDQARERGAAVLLVTHDVDEAANLASRVLVMAQGRIVGTVGSDATGADVDSLVRGAAQ